MNLNIIERFFDEVSDIFSDIENFVINNFENPVLWIFIVIALLMIVACAYNALSK